MKSYTDIEQSKKLAEFLPIKSADMGYAGEEEDSICCGFGDVEQELYTDYGDGHPCWSLAALLDIIPYPTLQEKSSEWRCASNNKERAVYLVGEADNNPIDACYKVIIKLHELKML